MLVKDNNSAPKSLWLKTSFANLVRYVPSGIYFARIRVSGKLIRRSLKTNKLAVAKLRLSDLERVERQRIEVQGAVVNGNMTFGDALGVFRSRLATDKSLKPRSKVYREERITALLKTWSGLEQTEVRKISKHDCLAWASKFGQKASPSNFNNTVGTLRMVIDLAIDAGARYDNPARFVKKLRVRQKELQLPSRDQFLQLAEHIERVNKRFSKDCANLVRFLAYGGFRKSEAANITWADCDFEKKEIVVRGDPETGDKSIELRDRAQHTTEEALARAEAAAAEARARADELARQVRERGGEMYNTARERGKAIYDDARERGKSAVDSLRKGKKSEGEEAAAA